MSEKLLPCPFCGGGNLRVGGDDKWVGAVCLSCGAVGPDQYGSSNDWNRRTPAPEGVVQTDPPVVPAPEGEAWRHVSQEEMAQAAKFASNNLASPVVPVGVSREEIARTLYEATPARVIHPLPIHSLSWDDIKTKDPARADRAYREADAILAALGTKGADTGWRDIATAPRDGTEVLLWTGRFARAASFRRGHWYACGASRPYLRPIAHWMPLPPAPTDTGANHD